MKASFLGLGIHLFLMKISTESEVAGNEDEAEVAGSEVTDTGSGDDSTDPFSSSLISAEEQAIKANEGLSLTEENIDSNNLNEGVETETPGAAAVASALSKDESMALEKSIQSGLSSKSNTPYWTEVMIGNKMQSVLIHVKTVTIIESVSSSDAKDSKNSTEDKKSKSTSTSTPASTSTEEGRRSKSSPKSEDKKSKSTSTSTVPKSTTTTAKDTSPYIKIRMPGSRGSSTSEKPGSTVKPVSSQSTVATESSKRRNRGSRNSELQSTASKSASQTISSKSTASSTAKKNNDKSAKSSSTISSSTKESRRRAGTAQTSTTTSSNDDTSIGSIFNILKNMPSGGKESESLYVEGTFKFPKKPELKRKVLKLNGYISEN